MCSYFYGTITKLYKCLVKICSFLNSLKLEITSHHAQVCLIFHIPFSESEVSEDHQHRSDSR